MEKEKPDYICASQAFSQARTTEYCHAPNSQYS